MTNFCYTCGITAETTCSKCFPSRTPAERVALIWSAIALALILGLPTIALFGTNQTLSAVNGFLTATGLKFPVGAVAVALLTIMFIGFLSVTLPARNEVKK
jgi:ABC-type antimicrobial peptide transport system permease subunit